MPKCDDIFIRPDRVSKSWRKRNNINVKWKKCYIYDINNGQFDETSAAGVIEKDDFLDDWKVPIPFDGKFYGWDDGSIFTLDTEGNVKTFANLSMDNIKNDEERDLDFSEVFRCGSMNENRDIYFFDTRFGAIRVLEYLK